MKTLENAKNQVALQHNRLGIGVQLQQKINSPLQDNYHKISEALIPENAARLHGRKYQNDADHRFSKRYYTLDFLISVDPQISIDPGKIGKNNKHRPSNKHRPWKNLANIIINDH